MKKIIVLLICSFLISGCVSININQKGKEKQTICKYDSISQTSTDIITSIDGEVIKYEVEKTINIFSDTDVESLKAQLKEYDENIYNFKGATYDYEEKDNYIVVNISFDFTVASQDDLLKAGLVDRKLEDGEVYTSESLIDSLENSGFDCE